MDNKLLEIIKKTASIQINSDKYQNKDFRDMGIDSLTFVSIIIEIEIEYGIEFPEEKMSYKDAGTLEKLEKVVNEAVNSKG